MQECDVDISLIKKALLNCKTDKVLPFRFISSAKYAPNLEPELERLMFKCLRDKKTLNGRTAILLDVSYSMSLHKISAKSELSRLEATTALAMLIREVCEDVDIYTFSKQVVQVPARHGFALHDIIRNSQPNKDTVIGPAINLINSKNYDRIITVSDGQTQDKLPAPNSRFAYFINIASSKNGVGYKDGWQNIDGWSESIIDYITYLET